MLDVTRVMEQAQRAFRTLLKSAMPEGYLGLDSYARFLAMEYHLTLDVQRYFFGAAAHPDMTSRRLLRNFLIRFAQEEEPHYRLAQRDLENLGRTPGASPLDVQLWHAYFGKVTTERPFLRLGAACVLETISDQAADLVAAHLGKAPYIRRENSTFALAHQHTGDANHGEQIVGVLERSELTPAHLADLAEGARHGATLYLRMFRWAMTGTDEVGP